MGKTCLNKYIYVHSFHANWTNSVKKQSNYVKFKMKKMSWETFNTQMKLIKYVEEINVTEKHFFNFQMPDQL